MKDNRVLNFLLTVLQIFMQMCVAVTATNLLLHGFMRYETFQVFNTLYIGIVVLVYYLARSYVNKGKVCLAIHVLAAVSVWFVINGSAEDKMLVFVPAAVLGFYSMKRTTQEPFVPLDMGIILACYFAGFSVKSESATVIPFYASVIYMAAFFVWYNIRNLNRFVSEHSRVKSFNTEQAVNVNSVMLAIFLLLCGVVMFLMPRLHLQTVITRALSGLWNVVLAAFHALNIQMPTGGYEKEQAMQSKPESTGGEMPEFFEMPEGNVVLDIIAAVFAVVIVGCMMILVIKALRDIRYKKSPGNDVKEFIRPEFKKKEKTVRTEKKSSLLHPSNDMAVRRAYKSTVRGKLGKNQRVKQNYTPREISSEVLGWTDEIKEVTLLYEKARYSDEVITKDEVEKMQKSRKMLK